MYQLSDKQIDYILNDISARGVEMEGLQENLLDHICCIIEQNLEANGDFESFYQKTIATFYKDALWEIEEETLLLLTFKNYYTMKKIMLWSGTLSVITLTTGIWFKYMHWPGATLFVITGILTGSLIFLPLIFTLKAKEKQKTKGKLVLATGAIGTILVCLSFLFRVMHWGHSIDLLYISAALVLLLFLPLYFFSGIKQPETKLSTITTSMLVILAYGLLFMMIRTPQSALHEEVKARQEQGISLEILFNERRLTANYQDSMSPSLKELNAQLLKLCEESQTYLFWRDTDIETASDSHEWKFDHTRKLFSDPIDWDQIILDKINKIRDLATKYNEEISKIGSKKLSRIRISSTILENNERDGYTYSSANVFNQLNQIQMFVLQNTRTIVSLSLHKKS